MLFRCTVRIIIIRYEPVRQHLLHVGGQKTAEMKHIRNVRMNGGPSSGESGEQLFRATCLRSIHEKISSGRTLQAILMDGGEERTSTEDCPDRKSVV